MKRTREIQRAIEKIPFEEFLGKLVQYKKIRDLINQTIRQFDARVSLTSRVATRGNMFFTGQYTYWNRPRIVLFLHTKKPDAKLRLTSRRISALRFFLSVYLQHELVHREQVKRIHDVRYSFSYPAKCSPRQRAKMRYLSDRDEVEASAHDLAMEIAYFYPNADLDTVLAYPKKYGRLLTHHTYRLAFRGAEWSEIETKLLEKAREWHRTVFRWVKPPALDKRSSVI